jgi:hypothetical protein
MQEKGDDHAKLLQGFYDGDRRSRGCRRLCHIGADCVGAGSETCGFGAATRRWRRAEHPMIEEPCAENNQHFEWHIPVADKPDF